MLVNLFNLHVIIHMKSGQSIFIKCREFTSTQSPNGGFTKINAKGVRNTDLAIDVTQIEAITIRRRLFFF